MATLFETLEVKPEQGVPLGNNCYKIRLAISSKNKGKRGGGRVITNFVIANNTVYLLTIYDKTVKDNLSDNELKQLLKNIPK